MNNKLLYAIIVLLLAVIVGAGAYFMLNRGSQQRAETNNTPAASSPIPTSTPIPSTPSAPQLSEQPNQLTFNEFFADAALAKLPAGVTFAPNAVVKTSVFNLAGGDQFCTSLDVIKNIPKHSYADAVYDTHAKSYAISRQASPRALAIGNSIGCEKLFVGLNKPLPVGSYEYKAYVKNILAIVLPFEVK